MSVLVPGDAVSAEGQQHERGAEHNDTERQPGPKSLFVGSSKPQRVTGGTGYDGLDGEPGCERVHRLDPAGSSLRSRCHPPLDPRHLNFSEPLLSSRRPSLTSLPQTTVRGERDRTKNIPWPTPVRHGCERDSRRRSRRCRRPPLDGSNTRTNRTPPG